MMTDQDNHPSSGGKPDRSGIKDNVTYMLKRADRVVETEQGLTNEAPSNQGETAT